MKKLSLLLVFTSLFSNGVFSQSHSGEKSSNLVANNVENNTVYIRRGASSIISPTGFEESNTSTPVSMSVITPAEIEAIGGNSLVEVLRTQIGIQIKDNIGDGSRAQVSMRGFGATSANNVLIVVDGRKLNNPTQESPLLSSIALKDVERIEIIQGSGGVLFGDQAVGGVINIITKKVTADQLSLSVSHGTDDLKIHKLQAAQQFENGLSYRFSGETKTADNYRDNNEANYDNIFARVDYDKEWGSLSFERTYIDDKLNTAGFLTNTKISANPRQLGTAGYSDSRINVERFNSTFFLTDTLQLENTFSLRDSNGDINSFGIFSKDTRAKTYSSKLLGRWNTNKGDIVLTTGYEDIKSDYQRSTTTSWVNEQTSVYTQLVYPLLDRLDVVAGARHTKVKDSNVIKGTGKQSSATARELGFNYNINKQRYFIRRAESFRFGNADDNGAVLAGVDFLKPQTNISYEAGIEFSFDSARLNVLVYDMDVNNEIYYDGIANANINLDKTNRKGIQIEIDKSLTSRIAVGAGYSRSQAKYTSGNHQDNDVPGVSKQAASAYIDMKLSNNVNLYLDAVYLGERFPESDDNNNSPKLGGYTITNMSVSWKKSAWDVNFRVNNLGNKKYSSYLFSSGGYPSPEVNYQLSFNYNFL